MKTIKQENFPQEGSNTAPVVLERILQAYATPSFGSMSKRDIDILMFTALQSLGIIDSNPQIYDVVRLLHITRAKARNLIYESTLRRQEEDKEDAYLKGELKRAIGKPIFYQEANKVCIEIDNPLLIDYVRQRLRDLGHITDGSFSSELVKMTPSAFTSLYVSILPEENLSEIQRKFVNLGVVPDNSPKAFVKKILMSVCKVALGKAGEELVEYAAEATGTFAQWITGRFENITADDNVFKGIVLENLPCED